MKGHQKFNLILKAGVFLFFLISMVLSCEKQNFASKGDGEVAVNPSQREIELFNKQTDALIASYLEEHGAPPTIEYTSLENLNELYAANGLQPITLEDLNLTEEEYLMGQERIKNLNNGDGIQFRCDVTVFDYLADYNRSGDVSSLDVFLLRRVVLGIDLPTPESDIAGWISWYCGFGNTALTTFDLNLIERRIITGMCPC